MDTLRIVKDFVTKHGKLYSNIRLFRPGYYAIPNRRPSSSLIAMLDSELYSLLGWRPFSGRTLTAYTDPNMLYGKCSLVFPVKPYKLIVPSKGSYIVTSHMLRSADSITELAYNIHKNLEFNLDKRHKRKEVIISARKCYVVTASDDMIKFIDDLF